MPEITIPAFPDREVNVVDFGAVGDGQTMNTVAINKAIESCASLGGGVVVIPPGLWLTGPIIFKSNINLHVEKGALVIFSRNHSDYQIIEDPKRDGFMVTPPIFGSELQNIAITGEGIFDGSGETWRPVKKGKTTEDQWAKLIKSGGVVDNKDTYWPTKEAADGALYLKKLDKKSKSSAKSFEPARDFLRPRMVVFYKCSNVLFDGPTFQNSPRFVVYPCYCENMVIRNIKVLNEWWAQNGDGIDISGGKNVLIYNCMVNCGDDGICMKSSIDKNYASQPALQNIVISDCVVYHAHGGFVIGSNTEGGMKNISVKNCNFISTDMGLRIKSSRGRGGLVENIYVNDIYMKNIAGEAISFDTYYENKMPKGASEANQVNETTPRFQKFFIRNIYCDGANQAIKITGLPEMPVQDLEFSDINIASRLGFSSMEAQNIRLNNVTIRSQESTVYTLENSWDFQLKNLTYPAQSELFMKLKGATTKNILIQNTPLSETKNNFEFGEGVNKSAVVIKK